MVLAQCDITNQNSLFVQIQTAGTDFMRGLETLIIVQSYIERP